MVPSKLRKAAVNAAAADSSTASPEKSSVVIVGGGPAGLAAAMMLARRGWQDITIVEKRPSTTFSKPELSYVYGIDIRGRQFLNQFGMAPQLFEAGVGTREVMLTKVFPDGKHTRGPFAIKEPKNENHWLPRSALMEILTKAVEADPQASAAIRILTSSSVTSITRHKEDDASHSLRVTVQTGTPGETTEIQLQPKLLLGCDGLTSTVRSTLQQWQKEDSANHTAHTTAATRTSSDTHGADRFEVVEMPSLSTGLRFKVLRVPPNPSTRNGIVMHNPSIAVLQGAPVKIPGVPGTATPIRLGMLPFKDLKAQRTANLITLPDHPIWKVNDAEAMSAILTSSFPQVDFSQWVSDDQMRSFASSPGGAFPAPQYTNGMAYVLPGPQGAQGGSNTSSTGSSGASGVLLLGDALHCFPPDLGQGVNSALEDVLELDRALDQCNDDIGAALPKLEQDRMPDVKALVHLAQVLAPLQYNQYPVRRALWGLRIAVHMLFSKIFPWFIPPPAVTTIFTGTTERYSNLWAQHQTAKKRLSMVGVAFAALAAALVLKASA